jgi:amino acid adenylation domain-containing protein
MYRTGDLVRQNEDGTFTTLGRRDMQVKIWGQRVEVGEIEYWTVRSHPMLCTAAAMLAQLGTARDQGVLAVAVDFTEDSVRDMDVGADADGFLKPSTTLMDTLGQVRSSLIEILPRYMVPELFVPMANLPFNTSGKLDRRAIQEAITTLSSQGGLEAYLPTSTIKADVNTETGRELRRLWAEVLGRPATTIGADDNFFHAGGDSLMAMRLVQLSRDAPFSLTVADIFEHPCLSDLAKNLEGTSTISDVEADGQELAPFSLWTELSPERPDALHSVVDEVAGRCAIAPEQIEDVYPCTPLQEGLMLATSRRPTAYVSRRLFTLDDAIDAPRLRDAWQQMGKAAPILRTRILLGRSAGSIQIVVNEDIPWQMSDTLDSYLDEDRAVGMAEGQPLVRLGLIVPPIGKRHFVFTAHHSVYDGWSMQLMYQQVAALYRREETPDLVPFTRFITYLDSANDEMAAEYWREQLTGDVTSDFPPLPQAKYQPLPTQRRTQQIEFGHRSRSTVPLPILLRAAWGILAAQHAGTSDIAFAATLSGRNAPIAGMTEMLAPTITTVPLRLHIDTSLTVRCFLKKLQRQATKMIPFEHTGLQRIKELVPDLASAVDIRHLFVVQPSMGNDDSATFPGMAPEPSAGETFDSFALTVECFLSPDTNQVTVEARFDQAIVSVRRMERMLESFARIAEQLDQAEQDPNQGMRISDIQTLSTSDLNQILVKNEQVPPKAEGLLHDLILKTAAQEPQHEAVSAWDGSLTYAELVRWSARLADYLAAIGVRPEVKVGLCMAKSRWAVVSMLAILRAGGTVVPIGVQLPFARIQHIIHDAAARIVLTDEQHIARLNSMGTELLKIEPSFLKTLTTSSIERPSTLRPQPSSAAWVVYTSGSTGMPKGVVLEHGSLCASTTAHGAAFGLNSDTRALQFASYTFDASIQEIFTTLRYGGCVCVPSEGQRMDELETCIAAMGVDFLSLTSTVANFLDPVSLPAVKTLVLLGEPVKPAVLDLWMDHVTVFNGYGPTECTIYSSCSPPITHKKHASLLGSPLSGCFWVVDSSDYNRLCPIGVHGELLIEGPLLARGYLNDPFKTNCSFVTDPRFVSYHGLGSGRRMYCTGDLVRQNEDNTYSIFGRKDTQVKIRGQRVEFGEIEYWVARSLSQVRQAAAMLVSRDAGRDEGTLVVAVELDKSISSELAEEYPDGMLAPSKALQASFDEIRDKLMEVLPRYMLPDMLIPMANLPLNSSGKLDRRALQQAMVSMSAAKFESYRSTFAAKDTTPEAGGQAAVGLTQELQSLWAKVLRKREAAIGLDDNFFNLGADSMSAMQLVAAARKAGLKLTVAQVFRNPVLRDLCRSIEHSDSPERRPVAENDNELTDASTRLAITSALAGRKVETIFETTDFQALAMSEHTVGNAGLVLYMTIAFDRKVDKGAVWTAYQHAVTTTEALRTMFVQHNDRTYQVVLGGFTGPLEECTASGSLTQFCQSLIENDQRKCLPMSEPPLKSWLAEGTSSDNFIVRLSHAQYDGLSLPLLLKELDGHESVLNMDGSPTRQMSYYISGLRSLDKKPAIEYWRGLLDQSRMPVLSTKSKHGDQRMKGTAATSVIPSLKQHHDGVTSATYVKAAWAMALARLNGETDIVFGHLISGRSVPLDDIDKVNGPCVNLIPIRVRTAAAWETVLGQVQDQQISTLPYEHLGFETIFKECTSWPLDPNQRPRFSTILQYQNLPDMCQRGSMHGAECRITYEATPANITDIWVSVEPKGDELHIFAGYFEDVVHSTVVQRLLDDFSQTLRSVQ